MPGFREIAGWLIALFGIALVVLMVYLAFNRYVFEAMALSLPAAVVFRGGLGLVRLGWAGRLAKDLSRTQASDR
jgi:hypothetical protein